MVSELQQRLNQQKAQNQARFMSDYQGMMLRTASNPSTFSYDGNNITYSEGSSLGTLDQAWNNFSKAAQSRGITPSYADFANQYNQMKAMEHGNTMSELLKLRARGVSDSKIKDTVMENPGLRKRLEDLAVSTANEEYAAFAQELITEDKPLLETVGDLPTPVKLGLGAGAVGGISYLSGMADPDALSDAEKVLEKAKTKYNKVLKKDGNPRANVKQTTVQSRIKAVRDAAKGVEDAGGTRASRLLKKVKGFTGGGPIAAGGAAFLAPEAAAWAEKAITGEDTGIAKEATQAGIAGAYGVPAVKESMKFIQTKGRTAGLTIANAKLGKEFQKAAAQKAAGKKISKKMEKKLASKLGQWAVKTAARQGMAATAGGWTAGLANIGMAIWSAADLASLGYSLATGNWD